MAVVGSVTVDDDPQEPHVSGTIYEVLSCNSCRREVLASGQWYDSMEPEDFVPEILLPQSHDRRARALLRASELDLECMKRTVEDARKCTPEVESKTTPCVGAAVVRDGKVLAYAYRGELAPGDHAEFTLLEGKCGKEKLAGSTVYTTLEPCTTRGAGKTPCVQWLIGRKVKRVVIGMLDPDERIRGRGVLALRKANIQVDLYPPELMTELEEMNRKFIAAREADPGNSM
jgi:pyrimidine deaminase RibD-like protein